ncbi:transporter [Roseateles sp.]|uniref:transporter n=1 Tax=Roseateles sp. TaxID=1971397 RepID=UPI0031DD13A3
MSIRQHLTPGAMSAVGAIGALLLAAAPAWAADGPDDAIEPDQPGIVESSSTVGKGKVLIETGLGYQRDKSDGVRSRLWSTPTLLRFGFAQDWEFRVETDGYQRLRATDGGGTATASGWADTALGVKWHVQDSDAESNKPGLAWLLHADLDSGSAAFRGNGVRPSLRLTAEWDLPHDWSAGLIGGVYRDRREASDGGGHFIGGILGASLGWPINERWKGYVELAGDQLASKRNGGRSVSAGTGLTWLADKRLQLDASLNRGLTRQTADWVLGLGVSVGF